MASRDTPLSIGIVGAGVIGLTTALCLVEAGHHVTVVADHMPGDFTSEWASPWAGALLAPHLEGDEGLQRDSLRHWHALLAKHPESGVREVEITEFDDDRSEESPIWFTSIYPQLRRLPPAELVPGATLGFMYRGLVVDPNVFLPWIFTTLQHKGISFLRRRVSSLQELKQITRADLVINASGLGARVLAADENVHPVRGQTMFVSCRDEDSTHHKRAVIYQGSHYTYAIPRRTSGGIILGGVSQPSNTSTAVDFSLRPDILRRVNEATGNSFAWVDLDKDIVRDIVGFRPGRTGGPRVERVGHVVHAYGVGGLGYLFAFGVAAKVTELVHATTKAML